MPYTAYVCLQFSVICFRAISETENRQVHDYVHDTTKMAAEMDEYVRPEVAHESAFYIHYMYAR